MKKIFLSQVDGKISCVGCLRLKIRFILAMNIQGKVRMSRWYVNYEEQEKKKLCTELHRLLVTRGSKYTNFIEVRITKPKSALLKIHGYFLSAFMTQHRTLDYIPNTLVQKLQNRL